MKERVLAWDGCTNVRDLGGLSTCDGRMTLWRAIVRSDTPARLTEAGWSALYAYGIRTIITLRTYGMVEDELNITPRYSDLATVQVAIEDITDTEFVQQWVASNLWGTPLYLQGCASTLAGATRCRYFCCSAGSTWRRSFPLYPRK